MSRAHRFQSADRRFGRAKQSDYDDETIEIECHVERDREGDKAIAISNGTMKEHIDPETGEVTERIKWFFIPKSKIVNREERGKVTLLTIPVWLATDRGLV